MWNTITQKFRESVLHVQKLVRNTSTWLRISILSQLTWYGKMGSIEFVLEYNLSLHYLN